MHFDISIGFVLPSVLYLYSQRICRNFFFLNKKRGAHNEVVCRTVVNLVYVTPILGKYRTTNSDILRAPSCHPVISYAQLNHGDYWCRICEPQI